MTIASTPWSITSGTTHSSLWVVAKGGRLVAEVWSGAGAKVKIADMAAMASANARLIAAAPELLAACRLLLSSAHDHQTGVAEAEAAIDRAGG
jgi:hypothetical protein